MHDPADDAAAEHAPFDAILVAAGGPSVPETLKSQLATGGRLVIPVGAESDQRLLKIVRSSEGAYEEENLGAVRFVPLVGEQGWAEDGTRAATNHVRGRSRRDDWRVAERSRGPIHR